MASTSIVPSNMRGTLSGLYATAESFGRFTSAVGFAVVFAWSISPETTFAWVDHRFVFYTSALALGVATMVAWRTPADILSEKSAATPAEKVDDVADVSAKTDRRCAPPSSRPTGEMDLI